MRLGSNQGRRLWAIALVVAPVLLAAILAWRRRWISDDGLVVVRTVRQILAGHGPVYNVGERAEPATSTVWTWFLTLASWASDFPVAHVAVAVGGALGCLGLGFAVDGTRRWWRLVVSRPRGSAGGAPWPLPAGILVYLALPPAWDFFTSGLETGLVTLWIGASWWLLIRLGEVASGGVGRGALLGASVWVGLGPLVRPELALVTIGLWISIVIVARPTRRRAVAAALVGAALPVGYQVFRMGYYGIVVPLPAVAKEAGNLNPAQGLLYVADFMGPYWLWVPGAILVVLLVMAAWRFDLSPGPLALALGPVLSAIVVAAYIVVVGGDFMHGRLLLPPLLLVLLPVLVVPATRAVAVGVLAVAAWALVCAVTLRTPYATEGPHRIDQERLLFVTATGDPHPIDERPFVRSRWATLDQDVRRARDVGRRELLYTHDGQFSGIPLRLTAPTDLAVTWPNPGILGAIVELDEHALDPLGLAYPLAAHLEPVYPDQPGRAKLLDPVWMAADYGPAEVEPSDESTAQVRTAQRALACGDLSERLAASRAPLTVERFWRNLTGAFGRTGVRIPVDPVAAEQRFCRPTDS